MSNILKVSRRAAASDSAAGDTDLVDKKIVAQRNSVSTRTIEVWVKQRRIPVVRLSPRMVRFNLRRVAEALAAYEVKEVS